MNLNARREIVRALGRPRISASSGCNHRAMQLEGRTFLITGGSSGLGAACATEFSRAGANVVIADVSERGAELARELGESVLSRAPT